MALFANDKTTRQVPGICGRKNRGKDEEMTPATEKLVQDIKVVVRDAEELLRATGNDLNVKTQEARQRLAATLESAKGSCQQAEQRLREGVREADELIREHPYESMGIGFGLGMLIGLLLGRK